MALNLKKGQKVDLTKGRTGLSRLIVGLGWDINKYDGNAEFDLDACAFLLGANGKATCEGDLIFYSNERHYSGAVATSGDNRTGAGEGDDETLIVDLSKVPANIERIAFTVTIYDAVSRRQNFGMINNSYIRIIDQDSNEELIKYDLGEDYSIETSIVVGEIYRHNGEWKFNAIGSGFQGGLEALCAHYGIDV